MNVLHKISLIGILLVCLQATNCLFTVKPDYNIEQVGLTKKPKAAVKIDRHSDLWEELSKYIDIVPYPEENSRIQLRFAETEEVNEHFGLIGILNLCILVPCWDSKDVKFIIRYYVDGKVKKEETFRERKKQWGWFPLFIYNVYALQFKEGDKFKAPNAYRILMNIGPNIAKTVSELENELNKETSITSEKESSEWEKVNKNSLTEIIEFNKRTPPGTIQNKANEFLTNLLDKKVQRYLEQNFPFVKPYLFNEVIDFEGSKFGYQFYQVFRTLILGKNPETGFKLEINLSEKDGKIIWKIDTLNEIHFLTFSPYKKNITLQRIISRGKILEKTLSAQETYLVGKNIFDMFSEFPTYNFTDIEFIEKIK
ncbi:hypothetical protein Q2296_01075 [Leptospira kirschneri]